MLPRENFGFLELRNAISCLLTRVFELICQAEIIISLQIVKLIMMQECTTACLTPQYLTGFKLFTSMDFAPPAYGPAPLEHKFGWLDTDITGYYLN